GLNEGVWPGTPAPDPWLNRRMRYDAGLLLPERQIGLAAHDFQQAVAADEVILTRALRDAEAETVPSRWLNRLTNLLKGLGEAGNQALDEMEARGTSILAMAAALDRPHEAVPPEPRPSPCPPVADRPNSLSVTQISKLIRDPYSIYAAKILDLQRLAPLGEPPDARAKGIALHNTMEAFLADRNAWHGDPAVAYHALSTAAWRVLSTTATDLAIARLWHARLMAAADRIVSGEIDRLVEGTPVLVEERGALPLATSGFRLTAKPDRIDRLSDGTYAVWDYKSGGIPTAREVAAFDKQLPLEAAMVEAGSFPGLGSGPVSRLGYIALSPSGKDRDEGVLNKDGAKAADVERADLESLIAAYSDPSQGYSARRAVKSRDDPSDYDHLSRRGEWDMSDDPVQFQVGGPE
ncbi:MAG: PD-(D/E)XK nuclease family protein, partial [Pseudomonadota bacterium]